MPTTISGTTGVDRITDGSVVQADLGTNVAGNGPAFSAYQSSAQSVANAIYTKIQLQTEEYDTASVFDAVTNYRFQPAVAGYYQVNAGVNLTNAAPLRSLLYKNGVEYKSGNRGGTGALLGSTISSLVYLNGTTDYIELYCYQASGGALNTSAGISTNYMNGFLARAA